MMRRALCLVAGCLCFSSCVPWTVRPLDDKQSQQPFDARRYVDSIWNAKVLPAASGQSVDIEEALRSAPRASRGFLVRGKGKVLRVDTSSRTGMLLIDTPPFDGRPDAAVQVGPVIRGTALRDALPFIQFSQFVNQLQFAQVGNVLNDRALASLPAPPVRGTLVSFSGAATWSAAGLLEIVPVTLESHEP